MTEAAIDICRLSKRYRLGQLRGAGRTLRDTLAGALNSWRRRSSDSESTTNDSSFWALRDVTFQVGRGEVVGVIGRNGAGKSTLLKVLSQITDPTEGSAIVNGRVGSLLEVGTGFHPELTGRENIYLNGAVLGMRRHEIKRQFDAIIDFAGVDRFLDTPVKRYSSGMYVRLAFAVAAHLEPEILLVDEVLAVGDAGFQQKCLGKMSDVASHGRTVLFVSHHMAAVRKLCPTSVWLSEGRLRAQGPTASVLDDYLAEVRGRADSLSLADNPHRQGDGRLRVTDYHLEDDAGRRIDWVQTGQPCTFVFRYETQGADPPRNVRFAIGLRDRFEHRLTRLCTQDHAKVFAAVPARGEFRCRVERFPLGCGRYTVGVIAHANDEIADYVLEAAALTVEPGDFFQSGRPATDGPVFVPHQWELREGESDLRAAA